MQQITRVQNINTIEQFYNLGYYIRKCLKHRPGSQYKKAAAPVWFPTLKSCCTSSVLYTNSLVHRRMSKHWYSLNIIAIFIFALQNKKRKIFVQHRTSVDQFLHRGHQAHCVSLNVNSKHLCGFS